MTVRRKYGVFVTAIGGAIIALVLTMWTPNASSEVSIRTIDVVARDMAFYVNGSPEPNPEITVRAGEHVRIRVTNEDAGMRHDFTIKAWTIATKMLAERGQEDVVDLHVPAERGTQTYQCTPHPKMMTGTIRVE